MRRLLALAATAALIFTAAGSASADDTGFKQRNPGNWLHSRVNYYDNATGNVYPASDGSKALWTRKRGDSPLDDNHRALRLLVKATADPSAGNNYAVVSTDRSRNINRRVGNVANLSYDTSTPGGGGAPRISVEFNNGEVAYLASEFCIANIPASGNRWKRADFTGAIDNCMFYVSDGSSYAADGTHSAWDNLVYAHPWWRVSAAYVVADAAGDYILDRISLGTNRMYGFAARWAINCVRDEDVC